MNQTATQLAGNASSIFEAWLDLKRQTSQDTQNQSAHGAPTPGSTQRRHGMSR